MSYEVALIDAIEGIEIVNESDKNKKENGYVFVTFRLPKKHCEDAKLYPIRINGYKNKDVPQSEIVLKVKNNVRWGDIACFIPEVSTDKYAAWTPEFPSDDTKASQTPNQSGMSTFEVSLVDNPWQEYIENPIERKQYIPTCDRGYIARYKKKNPNSQLVFNALPLPFFGKVKQAKVIFLSLNPGFNEASKKEAEDAKDPYLRHIAMRSLDPDCSRAYYLVGLNNEKCDKEIRELDELIMSYKLINCLSLAPEDVKKIKNDLDKIQTLKVKDKTTLLNELEGVRWWYNHLKELLNKGLSKEDLLENMAVIELVPYHSPNFHSEKFKYEELCKFPTVRFNVSLVKTAMGRNATMYVMRRVNWWKSMIKELEDASYYRCSNPQSVYITENNTIAVDQKGESKKGFDLICETLRIKK